MDYLINDHIYSYSYKDLRERYKNFLGLSDDEFNNRLNDALHLAIMICFVKEVPSSVCLSDEGIIHQLSHLLHIPDESLVDIKVIRELFKKSLELA